MKIESSNVQMASNRMQYTHLEAKTETISVNAKEAATIEFSDESKSLVEQLRDYKEKKKEEAAEQKKQNQENLAKNLKEMLKNAEANKTNTVEPIKTASDYKLEMLKKMVEFFKKLRESKDGKVSMADLAKANESVNTGKVATGFSANVFGGQLGAITLANSGTNAANVSNINAGAMTSASISLESRTQLWKKITVSSSFYTETEHTAYQSTGMVRTSDGREISFGVQVEMSRAFCEKFESFTEESFYVTDPLVINLDGKVGNISDQKFLFDLDQDGEEENISFAGSGSGFLALDKNGDGKINDGSELFGTKSGDGFKDLAEYDKDNNGWIDENDEIFKHLKVWTKDEDGNDVLLSLKDADVGAIHLGKASTEFSIKSSINKTHGIVRSTGVYLKESGGVGTVQQIDLTL